MKRAYLLTVLWMGSFLVASVASAYAYPRVRNTATERLCADPNMFESIAAGHLCSQYYSGRGWGGGWSGGSWNSNSSSIDRQRDSLTPDRQFGRVYQD